MGTNGDNSSKKMDRMCFKRKSAFFHQLVELMDQDWRVQEQTASEAKISHYRKLRNQKVDSKNLSIKLGQGILSMVLKHRGWEMNKLRER